MSISLDEQKTESAPRLRGPGSRLIAKKIEGKQEEMKECIERSDAEHLELRIFTYDYRL